MAANSLNLIGFGSSRISSQTRLNNPRIIASVAAEPERKKSPYEVLRVKDTATPVEIKAAYRALAKQFHPDVDRVGNGSEFMEIQVAYAVLTDPVAKARVNLERNVRRVGSYPNRGFATRRRWETDQCW